MDRHDTDNPFCLYYWLLRAGGFAILFWPAVPLAERILCWFAGLAPDTPRCLGCYP